jgi:hypothetical protein
LVPSQRELEGTLVPSQRELEGTLVPSQRELEGTKVPSLIPLSTLKYVIYVYLKIDLKITKLLYLKKTN